MNADMLVTVRCCATASTKKTHLCPSVFIRGSIFHRRLRRYQPQINTHERRYVGNRTVLSDRLHEKDSFVSICIYPWFNLPPPPKNVSTADKHKLMCSEQCESDAY